MFFLAVLILFGVKNNLITFGYIAKGSINFVVKEF
jgi:hypothetical protein